MHDACTRDLSLLPCPLFEGNALTETPRTPEACPKTLEKPLHAVAWSECYTCIPSNPGKLLELHGKLLELHGKLLELKHSPVLH